MCVSEGNRITENEDRKSQLASTSQATQCETHLVLMMTETMRYLGGKFTMKLLLYAENTERERDKSE